MTHQNLDNLVVQHMRRDCPCLLAQQTVGEALNSLREHPPTGPIIYFYVVDAENHCVVLFQPDTFS